MTTDAILLNDRCSGIVNMDNLRFQSERKHERMPCSIHCFEKIFAEGIVMGNMTIIANSYARVAAPFPRCKLRCHHMAIHACSWIIRKIRSGITDIQCKKPETEQCSNSDQYRNFPLGWRNEQRKKCFYVRENRLHRYCTSYFLLSDRNFGTSKYR